MNGNGFWKKEAYVIDVGSTNVTVYRDGLLLKEPSMVVVRKGAGMELIAAGAACNRIAPNPEYNLIRPIQEGAVIHPEAAGLMLESFLNRVIRKRVPAPDCYALVSAGLSATERDGMESALRKGGARNVMLVENVLALLPYVDPTGSLVMIFGGGTTEIGIVSADGIISACSINVAGDTANRRIIEYVRSEFKVSISFKTAERLKTELGSLYDNDASYLEVAGKDILEGTLKSINVPAEGIRNAIRWCYDKAFEVAESLVATLPPDVIQSVKRSGLRIAGAGAEIRGLKEYAYASLQLRTLILPNPEYACSEGLYRMASQSDRYFSVLPRQ